MDKKHESKGYSLDHSPEIILKNEIIKIYNNNKTDNNEENNNNMFLFDNDQTLIDSIKLKKVFSESKKLILEIMRNKTETEKYSTIEINPYGYINSKRQKKDGITYFGNCLNPDDEMNTDIDFFINNNDEYYEDDGNCGRHFMIKFNPDDLNYYIKDLGKGFGTFIKIQEWTEIKNNYLLNIGDNYIVLSFDDDEDEVNINNIINEKKIDNSINIKIFSLSSQIKSYKFLPSKCPITIGRSKDNHIYIDDDMLSRIHCTIDYGNEKWYIQDGYAKNGLKEEEIKKSTNGCWIYAFDEIEIVNGMIFKSNHNIFICNLV